MAPEDRAPSRPPSTRASSSRREVLAGVVGAAALAGFATAEPPPPPAPAPPPSPAPVPPDAAAPPAPPALKAAALPLRPFGATGEKVSLFGLGCFPLGGLPAEEDAVELVRLALELGCTYFDTAPSYGEGRSERRLGLALRGRPRSSYVLASKTHTRTEREARLDLEQSLTRLGVERLDLLQVHAVGDAADLERVLAKDGPLRALEKAREEGLVRWIGVTGHRDPRVMAAAIERYPFDALLFPLNCVDPHHQSFVAGTLPAAVTRGIARVAMKVFASGKLPTLGVQARDCLRYTYGLDIATAIVGCSTPAQVRLAAEVACEPGRLAAEEEQRLLAATHPHRGASTEWYKRQD